MTNNHELFRLKSGFEDEQRSQYSDDEQDTVDMENSENGFTTDTSELTGKLNLHPRERRLKSERLATYVLVGFLVVMFLSLIPLSRQHSRENTTYLGDGMQPVDDEMQPVDDENGSLSEGKDKTDTTTSSKLVYCGDRTGLAVSEWLRQSIVDSASLCDPVFHPESKNADIEKPVKVFIMMGEANMVGAGQMHGSEEGTLEHTVMQKKRFTHLVDHNLEWKSRPDVRHVAVSGDFDIHRNELLGVYEEHPFFGPELQFGYVMGELLDEPVLLLKSCSGHNSLGGDLLPPGSHQYEFDGYVYAGYGESPRRWQVGTTPRANSWYAGNGYDLEVSNARQLLQDIGKYYPGATNYEVAGFVWWHGDSDRRDPAYAQKYEENLSRLIESLRLDFRAPEAKFAIATVGQQGKDMAGETLQLAQAQLALNSEEYPEFIGNVATVDIRSSWHGPYQPGFEGDNSHRDGAHYGNNAETVMEVGNALGIAMAELLIDRESK